MTADRPGRRVAIMHQGFVPHYRVRFFELLNRTSDVEYVVLHGPPPPGLASVAAEGPFAFPNIWVPHRQVPLRGRTAIYQPLMRLVWGFDAIVLGTHFLFASNHFAFACFKARRRPVLYWGHGHEQADTRVKARLARLADGYLAYTDGGARWLAAHGFPPERITVVRNTLDVQEEASRHARLERVDELSLRAELGLASDTTVLLYLGRFYESKRLPDLVEAYRLLRARTKRPLELVLIGDGPTLAEVRTASGGLDGIHFTGAIQDADLIARYLRVAAALVSPGAVGLSVNHALAHATPVITRSDAKHGPELEYLRHGANGLVVEGDLEAFVSALRAFVDSPAAQDELAAGARASRESLRLEPMVEAFDRGVRAALDRAYPERKRSAWDSSGQTARPMVYSVPGRVSEER
jgi:glycosyltransferase involved in cell wall biosynthesis